MIMIIKPNSNVKPAVLPIVIFDYLNICDPVLKFDNFMEEIDLEKYLKEIPNIIRKGLDTLQPPS